jgi:hypothetical protein
MPETLSVPLSTTEYCVLRQDESAAGVVLFGAEPSIWM